MPDLIGVMRAVAGQGKGEIPTAPAIAEKTGLSLERVKLAFAGGMVAGYGVHILQRPEAFFLGDAGWRFVNANR